MKDRDLITRETRNTQDCKKSSFATVIGVYYLATVAAGVFAISLNFVSIGIGGEDSAVRIVLLLTTAYSGWVAFYKKNRESKKMLAAVIVVTLIMYAVTGAAMSMAPEYYTDNFIEHLLRWISCLPLVLLSIFMTAVLFDKIDTKKKIM